MCQLCDDDSRVWLHVAVSEALWGEHWIGGRWWLCQRWRSLISESTEPAKTIGTPLLKFLAHMPSDASRTDVFYPTLADFLLYSTSTPMCSLNTVCWHLRRQIVSEWLGTCPWCTLLSVLRSRAILLQHIVRTMPIALHEYYCSLVYQSFTSTARVKYTTCRQNINT